MARPPKWTDRFVGVRAYLTDEVFGYEHWRAAQFCQPEDAKWAVLVICGSRGERDAILTELETLK